MNARRRLAPAQARASGDETSALLTGRPHCSPGSPAPRVPSAYVINAVTGSIAKLRSRFGRRPWLDTSGLTESARALSCPAPPGPAPLADTRLPAKRSNTTASGTPDMPRHHGDDCMLRLHGRKQARSMPGPGKRCTHPHRHGIPLLGAPPARMRRGRGALEPHTSARDGPNHCSWPRGQPAGRPRCRTSARLGAALSKRRSRRPWGRCPGTASPGSLRRR